MSLFRCQSCGSVDNTVNCCQAFVGIFATYFSWEGIEHRRGMQLCSACGPAYNEDGTPSGFGQWHGEFERIYLPPEWVTNDEGNLEHVETGEVDYIPHAIKRD